MAFVMDEHKDVIQKVTLNIGTFLGCENAEDAHLTLRETNYLETLALKKASAKGEEGVAEYMKTFLPAILVEHDIFKTADVLATNEEVTELVFSKMELGDFVAGEYFKAVFTSRLSKTEEK